MNDQGNIDVTTSIQKNDARQQYTAPTLVTFGAIRDLTAGGSSGKSEHGRPGGGEQFGHRG
ncbi:hypothetical protein [Cognatiluteimonas profundi]|uniref:hypothetical protein n=1 Tax=Cognatiluteimonas profundi TaxID=2594501 RepID=UPI00131C03B9|nr:hypothetical protein [Lysobacter profundi]